MTVKVPQVLPQVTHFPTWQQVAGAALGSNLAGISQFSASHSRSDQWSNIKKYSYLLLNNDVEDRTVTEQYWQKTFTASAHQETENSVVKCNSNTIFHNLSVLTNKQCKSYCAKSKTNTQLKPIFSLTSWCFEAPQTKFFHFTCVGMVTEASKILAKKLNYLHDRKHCLISFSFKKG